MDCEKFDQHAIDALYDELDELTMAAMKRHMDSCPRCAGSFSALRATRDVAVLPLEEPSDALESRILFAASAAQRKTPWHKKALRGLAWAGSHAMRPQLAMAAVFVLVIGSSLLLLRAKPGTTAIGPVKITERGEPSPDRDEGGQALSAPAAAASAAAVAEAPVAAGAAEPAPPTRGDGKEEKDKQPQDDAKTGKGGDAQAALASAKAAESASGCDAALPKYEEVGVRFTGTPQAAEAMWSSANCHKKLGDAAKARELYSALEKRDEYKEKAAEALNEIAPLQNNAVAAAPAPPAATAAPAGQAPGGGGRAGAAAAPAPVAAPQKAAAKPPPPQNATTQNAGKQAPGWGGARGNAAPEKRATDVNSSGF